jgi:hypothetical protein
MEKVLLIAHTQADGNAKIVLETLMPLLILPGNGWSAADGCLIV